MGIEPDRFNILNDVKTMVKLSKISIQNNPDQKFFNRGQSKGFTSTFTRC